MGGLNKAIVPTEATKAIIAVDNSCQATATGPDRSTGGASDLRTME